VSASKAGQRPSAAAPLPGAWPHTGNLPTTGIKVGRCGFAQQLLEAEAIWGGSHGFDGMSAVKETVRSQTSQLLQGAARRQWVASARSGRRAPRPRLPGSAQPAREAETGCRAGGVATVQVGTSRGLPHAALPGGGGFACNGGRAHRTATPAALLAHSGSLAGRDHRPVEATAGAASARRAQKQGGDIG